MLLLLIIILYNYIQTITPKYTVTVVLMASIGFTILPLFKATTRQIWGLFLDKKLSINQIKNSGNKHMLITRPNKPIQALGGHPYTYHTHVPKTTTSKMWGSKKIKKYLISRITVDLLQPSKFTYNSAECTAE